MQESFINESMMEMYLFESSQQLETLEQILIQEEKTGNLGSSAIDELFRIMHTLKGSSSMMMIENLALLAHSIEDLFAFLKKNQANNLKQMNITEIMLDCADFIKEELDKIRSGAAADGDSSVLVQRVKEFLKNLDEDGAKDETTRAHSYNAVIYFDSDCEMVNVRAYGIIHNLKEVAWEVSHIPEDLLSKSASEWIMEQAFQVTFKTELGYEDVKSIIDQAIFVREIELDEVNEENLETVIESRQNNHKEDKKPNRDTSSAKIEEMPRINLSNSSMISVNVKKLDSLMDLVGELMISSQMVTKNPYERGPQYNEFKKQASIHRKLISELQDISMSLRMVPLTATFNKMGRIIHDVSKKLDKEIRLEILGEDTEIDKNIVESISDPLMHLVRNAADHGIEDKNERAASGKDAVSTITLEARNVGGEVWIIVKDDGRGLVKEKIYNKARSNGLTNRELIEMTDDEVYSMIFNPGFSTKENVTEFSGRGVGLDVVMKNIISIGGSVSVSSTQGKGTSFTIRIPLTLAIIGGMIIEVGEAKYAIPTMSVKECFRPKIQDIITDPNENEMIIVRGECYSIVRLHDKFNVETKVKELHNGVLIMVESENDKFCIFTDKLLGEQEIVIKPLPELIRKKINGISGCTLLGDGCISLILDMETLTTN